MKKIDLKAAVGPLAAVVACLALYWPGLTAWFQRDDFAWLGVAWQTAHGMPLSQALFAPMAGGTVRVLSERLYFMLFYSLFGLNALPYRIAVFATQAASLFLLASITRRLTRSGAAAFWVGILWIVNSALTVPLSWCSAFNEVLCAFFVLASLRLLLQYLETGRRGYYAAQWLTFLLGFGASEFMIVYPAAAALLVMVRYRRLPSSVLVLFVPSAVFAAYHVLVLKPPAEGPYALKLDARIFSTLATYWWWSLGPGQWEWIGLTSARVAGWLTVALTVPLVAFASMQAWRREFLPAALLTWYVLWLAPVIALPNHIIEYYPALATVGLAMFGAVALATAWRSGKAHAPVAVLVLATYLLTSAVASRISAGWHHDQSMRVKSLFLGVAEAQAKHPGKTILISGVGEELFWTGVFDNPFRLMGGAPVYLTPETPDWVRTRPELGDVINRYEMPENEAEAALSEGRAVRYDAGTNQVMFHQPLGESGDESQTVAVGNALSTPKLGEGWYQAEGTHRWMAKRASLMVARPRAPGEKLRIQGYAPAFLLKDGPLRLTVSAEGRGIGVSELNKPDSTFTVEFTLPAALAGEGQMRLTLEVNKVVRPPSESRNLGLAITSIAVRRM